MIYTPSEDPNAVDHDLMYSPELLGQECNLCWKLLRFRYFDKDSSYRIGYKPSCIDCLAQPCLSIEEHGARLKQLNFSSEGTKRQRHEDQEEFRKEDEREGKKMHTSDLVLKLHKLVPNLFIKEGGIVGHLALYEVAETPHTKWEGRNYNFLGGIEYDTLPEYSQYEFDEVNDIVLRESRRGWRTVLLRFIKAGLLTEEQSDKEFGKPSGRASAVWKKQLWNHRHNKSATPAT